MEQQTMKTSLFKKAALREIACPPREVAPVNGYKHFVPGDLETVTVEFQNLTRAETDALLAMIRGVKEEVKL